MQQHSHSPDVCTKPRILTPQLAHRNSAQRELHQLERHTRLATISGAMYDGVPQNTRSLQRRSASTVVAINTQHDHAHGYCNDTLKNRVSKSAVGSSGLLPGGTTVENPKSMIFTVPQSLRSKFSCKVNDHGSLKSPVHSLEASHQLD
eukprot:3182518-Amphidinium_carterae.1